MWRQHATILDIIACCVAVPDMCHQRPIEWTCGSWRVFDFLLMLPTLTKASFQGFGSCLSVDILFWCWDPTLAHSASCDHFALTTTHPPCSASSLLPLPNKCLNIDICESPTLFASIYPIKMWFYWSKQVLWTSPLPLLSDWHLPHNYHICSLLFPPPFPPTFPSPYPLTCPPPYVCFFWFLNGLYLGYITL